MTSFLLNFPSLVQAFDFAEKHIDFLLARKSGPLNTKTYYKGYRQSLTMLNYGRDCCILLLFAENKVLDCIR